MSKILVYNITGSKILSIKSDDYALQAIDLSRLSPGMYLLEIDTELGAMIYKILINRQI